MQRSLFPLIIAVICLYAGAAASQEFNARVVVDARQLIGADRTSLAGFPQSVQDYINSYNWSGGSWNYPPISLSLQISFTKSGGGTYDAQLLAVASRAIAGSDQTTTVLRVIDNSWEFSYSPDQPLDHQPGIFNSLASMIDCYAYIALGCAADTYMDLGGSAYFHQAYTICLQGQSSSTPQGWGESDGANYTRFSFINELLSPRLEQLRRLSYSYHHNGLDSLSAQPDDANRTMLGVLDSLVLLKNSLNGPSIALERFMDAKYLELAQFFANFPDKGTLYDELETIDPSHQTYYEQYRNQ